MGWLRHKENKHSMTKRACRFTHTVADTLLATSLAKKTGPEEKSFYLHRKDFILLLLAF